MIDCIYRPGCVMWSFWWQLFDNICSLPDQGSSLSWIASKLSEFSWYTDIQDHCFPDIQFCIKNPSTFCTNIDKPRNRFQQFNSFTKTSYLVPLTSYWKFAPCPLGEDPQNWPRPFLIDHKIYLGSLMS